MKSDEYRTVDGRILKRVKDYPFQVTGRVNPHVQLHDFKNRGIGDRDYEYIYIRKIRSNAHLDYVSFAPVEQELTSVSYKRNRNWKYPQAIRCLNPIEGILPGRACNKLISRGGTSIADHVFFCKSEIAALKTL